MTKRGEQIPRPNPWTVQAASPDAGGGWDELRRQAASALDTAWVAITSDPRRSNERQHRLRGRLDRVTIAGNTLEQWQYEVSGAARVWYGIDDAARTLWITAASTGHPKSSEKITGHAGRKRN